MVKGIESEDWYGSETARALRMHIEKRIDELVDVMVGLAGEGQVAPAARCAGGIQVLEQLRNDISQEGS